MISEELRAQIKKIKIISKRLVQTSLVGDYSSAFKGQGMEFHQIREYHPGDDVRRVDWNSFARTDKLMVKQFVEERDRTVIFAVDVSASADYSSKSDLRKETITQVASTLAFIASENKDRIGALFFSDKIEKWIEPRRGALSFGKIVEALLTFKPQNKKTSIKEAFKFLVSMKKRNAIVFILSDWIDDERSYSKFLKVASCKHDLIAVRFLDDCEKSFVDVGLLDVIDHEAGNYVTLNSSKKVERKGHLFQKWSLSEFLDARLKEQKKFFDSYKVDILDLSVGHPFVGDIAKFFHKRTKRSI